MRLDGGKEGYPICTISLVNLHLKLKVRVLTFSAGIKDVKRTHLFLKPCALKQQLHV